ncbi:hypothetical protein [Paracoccus sp. N5]|uniref:hypothetical protein n=1 Tax=Paracoccus sp. N5 TaxID=1101189 RepID=UPI0003619316|nr:hypothetical protein [Paracoccus sp. N5]
MKMTSTSTDTDLITYSVCDLADLAAQMVAQVETAQALHSEAWMQEVAGRKETAETLRELADERTHTALRGLTHLVKELNEMAETLAG